MDRVPFLQRNPVLLEIALFINTKGPNPKYGFSLLRNGLRAKSRL
jgi:hypothetical protein